MRFLQVRTSGLSPDWVREIVPQHKGSGEGLYAANLIAEIEIFPRDGNSQGQLGCYRIPNANRVGHN